MVTECSQEDPNLVQKEAKWRFVERGNSPSKSLSSILDVCHEYVDKSFVEPVVIAKRIMRSVGICISAPFDVP